MSLSRYVDPKRCLQLVTGVAGIYISYLVTGIVHESMLKGTYVNDLTSTEDKFTFASGFLVFPCGITWLVGALVNHFQIKPEDRTNIPAKNAIICAITVSISTLTYTYAIYLTNYPVVMMFKSCNILSVILVGVLCSRVVDKKLKLGSKKIVVGILVTLGIVLFKLFDPEAAAKDEKKTEIAGIVLLIVSLLADGFLPDFQAEIKSKYKPLPMEMMTEINKWVCLLSIVYALVLGQFFTMCTFIITHRVFLLHMSIMGALSAIGQMFVYRMIKQFKQHFVPFVITTRKIFTVALSIVFYHHETNAVQVFGLLMVFSVVTFEFVSELMGERSEQIIVPELTEENPGRRDSSLVQPQEASPNRSTPTTDSISMSDEVSKKEGEMYQQRIKGDDKSNDKQEDLVGMTREQPPQDEDLVGK